MTRASHVPRTILMSPWCDFLLFMKKKFAVIGIGNPLRKDDGIGIILLQRIRQYKKNLPGIIDYIDGGTGGLNLLHVLARYDFALLIDAVDFKGRPGDSRFVSLEELRNQKRPVSFSTHETDFLNVIRLSEGLDELPQEVFVFAVQPKDVSFGPTLSEEIVQKLDTLTLMLRNKIQSLNG